MFFLPLFCVLSTGVYPAGKGLFKVSEITLELGSSVNLLTLTRFLPAGLVWTISKICYQGESAESMILQTNQLQAH